MFMNAKKKLDECACVRIQIARLLNGRLEKTGTQTRIEIILIVKKTQHIQ